LDRVTSAVADENAPPATNGPELWLARFPWPSEQTHKHSRGRLFIVGSSRFRTGATRLAARAGLRIGAGVVTVAATPEAAPIYAAALEAVILKVFETEGEFEALAQTADAALVGPNLGINEDTRGYAEALTRTGAALVVDADALSVFKDEPDALFGVLDRDDVLTPHDAEFERLFPGLLKDSADRLAAARAAARRAGGIVVLKGTRTVVAAPDGRAAVNEQGSPWLATAGSGDVLAGFIGGLMAQGMPSFEAACAAVWVHSEAARAFGPGLIAEDLPDVACGVLEELYRSSGQASGAEA
jgi:hydroxyethylthiazole kinase-like uncharacterized protein yjeF